jgi:hypothetical protein
MLLTVQSEVLYSRKYSIELEIGKFKKPKLQFATIVNQKESLNIIALVPLGEGR